MRAADVSAALATSAGCSPESTRAATAARAGVVGTHADWLLLSAPVPSSCTCSLRFAALVLRLVFARHPGPRLHQLVGGWTEVRGKSQRSGQESVGGLTLETPRWGCGTGSGALHARRARRRAWTSWTSPARQGS